MSKIDGYAANLSPVSLVLPEYERFQIDGQRIGERWLPSCHGQGPPQSLLFRRPHYLCQRSPNRTPSKPDRTAEL